MWLAKWFYERIETPLGNQGCFGILIEILNQLMSVGRLDLEYQSITFFPVLLYYIIIFLFGAALGSFINVIVWRTHESLPIMNARSICPGCREQIRLYDNIPIVSFLWLRGRCRQCQGAISRQYPLVELWMGFAFLIAYRASLMTGAGFFLRDAAIIFFLTIIFLYDFRYGEILDRFTLVPATTLFFFSWYFHWQSASSMLIGAVVGAGFFLAQYLASRGQWIGGGDIRLGVFMGVILGFPAIIMALLFAYILGAIISAVFLILKKKTMTDATPFGTYLTVGTVIAMIWGNNVIEWYMHFL